MNLNGVPGNLIKCFSLELDLAPYISSVYVPVYAAKQRYQELEEVTVGFIIIWWDQWELTRWNSLLAPCVKNVFGTVLTKCISCSHKQLLPRRNTSCWLHEVPFGEISLATHVLLYMPGCKQEKSAWYSPMK